MEVNGEEGCIPRSLFAELLAKPFVEVVVNLSEMLLFGLVIRPNEV
jgi:hypothetical protein